MKAKLTRRSMLRLQSLGLVAALCVAAGLAAWASVVWHHAADWTWSRQNSLTPASRQVLTRLDKPVTITAFARPGDKVANYERRLLSRYQRADARIRVRFANPDTALAKVRKLGIDTPGELHLSYGTRDENLKNVSESGITNALLRLARGAPATIVFITGHGESAPDGKRNFDMSRFTNVLKQQGFRITTQNLSSRPDIEDNAAFVMIAGPQDDFLPRESAALEHWLARGGNLLWLHDPGTEHGLDALAGRLGVKPLDGTLVDTTSAHFGISKPTWLVLSDYGDTPVTRELHQNTLFPDATGFTVAPGTDWHARTFLHSRRLPASWLITGTLSPDAITYRPGTDTPGPVAIGIILTRTAPGGHGQQRAAVVGNSSFLSNSFLGNGGNLNLGLNLCNWLAGQDRYIDVTVPAAPDRTLALSGLEQGGIGIGFLFVLPIILLLVAILVWWRRARP